MPGAAALLQAGAPTRTARRALSLLRSLVSPPQGAENVGAYDYKPTNLTDYMILTRCAGCCVLPLLAPPAPPRAPAPGATSALTQPWSPAPPPLYRSLVWTSSKTVLDALDKFNDTCAFTNPAAPYCKPAQALSPFRYIVSPAGTGALPVRAHAQLCMSGAPVAGQGAPFRGGPLP